MSFDIARKITFALGLSGEDKVKSGIKGVTDSMTGTEKAVASAKMAFTGLLGVVSVGALSAWVKSGIDAADAAYQISQKTGLATKDVAGLQLAFKLGVGSADGMTTAMAKMGKQAVEGNDAFKRLGVETRNADGTMRSVKDVLYDTADAFSEIKDGTSKSVLAMEIFGKTGGDLIPMLNEGSEGLREMAEMAERLGLVIEADVAAQADKFNDTLDLLKKSGQGVATQMAAQLLPALNSVAGGFLNWLTEGDRVVGMSQFLGNGLKILYSILAGGIEIVATIGKGFGALGAAIAAVFTGNFTGAKEVMADFLNTAKTDWTSTIANIGTVWDGTAAKTAAAGAALTKVQRDVTLASKDSEDAAKAAARAKEKEAEAYQNFKGKLTELIQAQEQQLTQGEKLTAADKLLLEAKQKLTGAELATVQAMIAVAKEQERALELRARETAATADAVKARNEALKALDGETSKLVEQIEAQNAANLTLATGVDRTKQIEVARLRDAAASAERRAMIALERNEDEAQYNAFKDNAEKLRELADAKEKGIGLEAARKAADEWTKVSDQISQGLTDSLYRAFESGRGFFSTLWAGIKNTFKTTVLRLVVDAVMNPVKTALNQSLGGMTQGIFGGGGGAAGGPGILGGLGQIGSMLGEGLGSIGSLLGFGGTGIAGAFAGVGAASAGGVAALTPAAIEAMIGTAGYGASAAGAAAAAGSAAGAAGGTAAAAGSGLMGTLGAAMPYLSAALFIAQAFKHKPTHHKGSVVTADGDGAHTGGADPTRILNNLDSDTDKALKSLAGGAVGVLNSLSTAFGGSGGFAALTKFAADGEDASFGAFDLTRAGVAVGGIAHTGTNDAKAYTSDAKAAFEAFGADVGAVVRSAIDTIDLPQWASDALAELGSSPGLDSLAQAAQAIAETQTKLRSLADVLTPMGGIFERLATLSDDAKVKLAGMVGGIDALVAKSQSFVEAYYSDEEKLSIVARNILGEAQKAGVDSATYNKLAGLQTKDEFRALLESLALTGSDENSLELAALGLNLAGPFASIAAQLEDLDITLAEAAAAAIEPAVLRLLNDATANASESASDDAAATDATTAEAVTSTAANTAATAQSLAAASQLLREIADGITADTAANAAGLTEVIAKLTAIDVRIGRIESLADLSAAAPT